MPKKQLFFEEESVIANKYGCRPGYCGNRDFHFNGTCEHVEEESVSEETGKGIDEARAIAAQCWCQPKTSHKMMDSVIAEEFAKTLLPFLRKAALCERMVKILRALRSGRDKFLTSGRERTVHEMADECIAEYDREAKK